MSSPSFWQSILVHLHQPEYVHVLLNPIPIYGLVFGMPALVIAMILRSRPAQITGLMLIFMSAVSTIPVAHYGEAGYDTVEAKMPTDLNDAWIDAHAQRAHRAMPAFYVLMALSLAALVVPWKWPKSALALNCVTLVYSVFVFVLVTWIAYAGGQAMHQEFNGGSGMPVEPVGGYDKMR